MSEQPIMSPEDFARWQDAVTEALYGPPVRGCTCEQRRHDRERREPK